ncbi:hypothetical protein G7054_g5824 [Neopestalotiopsis clavispora]|nr:hypothetical protein G7054_g5824 [Neopestalotiopsis clavispora]
MIFDWHHGIQGFELLEIAFHFQRFISQPTLRNTLILAGVWTLLRKINAKWSRDALNNETEISPWDGSREIALVTGGSSGIGADVVCKLAERCAHVIIFDIQPPRSHFPDNVAFYRVNITNADEIHKAAEDVRQKFGYPTVLVNNAGVGGGANILDRSEAQIRLVFDVNVIAHFLLVKEFLPAMVESDHGHVVSVASMASFVTVASVVDYGCSKAAALSFHEGLTQELKHRYNAPRVRTSIIHPHWVRTPMIEELLRKKPGIVEVIEPGEISDAVVAQVTSGQSGQVILPKKFSYLSGLRGYPSWFQEKARAASANVLVRDMDYKRMD